MFLSMIPQQTSIVVSPIAYYNMSNGLISFFNCSCPKLEKVVLLEATDDFVCNLCRSKLSPKQVVTQLEMLDDARDKLDVARDKLDDARDKLDDARKLVDMLEHLDDARKQLELLNRNAFSSLVHRRGIRICKNTIKGLETNISTLKGSIRGLKANIQSPTGQALAFSP
jgi:hypothetical protein